MLCTRCGAQIDATSNFCPNCGQKNTTSTPSEPTSSSTQSKKIPFWFKAIIALTAIGIVVGSIIALMQEDATDVVEEQLQALKEDHLTEAYYNYTSKGFRESTSLEEFKDFAKSHSAFIKNSSIEFLERNIQDDEGYLEANLSSVSGVSTRIDFQMVREGDKWKILSIRIEEAKDPSKPHTDTSTTENSPLIETDNLPLLAPIKEQLAAFKQGDLSGSYQKVISKKFAEKTPQNIFEEYIKGHPVFLNYTAVQYSDVNQHGGNGSAKITLKSPEGTATVDYELLQEGNTWKIWSLHLEENSSIKDSEFTNEDTSSDLHIEGFNAAPLFETIKDQLKAIREQDLSKAYNNYTSEDFKKSTSQNDFDLFIKGQPGLNSNTDIKFKNLTFDNNIANISGVLKNQNGTTFPVEYNLVLENDKWKIIHIQILPAITTEIQKSTSTSNQPVKFSKFILGTETDAQGIVLDPGKTFKENSGDLYLNLYVTTTSPGIKIEVLFTHVDSKSSIAPVSATLSEKGENILSFVFSPPKNGWPKGIYRLQATSSSGAQDSFNFKVN